MCRVALWMLFVLCAWIAGPVMAQPIGVSLVNVGECYMAPTNQTFLVQEQWSMGQPSWWMRDNSPAMPPKQVFPVAPDPSGVAFLAVASAIPSLRFWVTWDMKVIQVTPAGHVSQIGHCGFFPAFVSKFVQPVAPPPPQQWGTATFDFSAQVDVAGNVPTAVQVPNDLLSSDKEFARPLGLTMTAKQASVCNDQSQGNPAKFYDCMLLANLGVKERAAYECVKNANGDTSRATLCLMVDWTGMKDNTVAKQALNCYQQYQDNWNAYPLCLAGQANNEQVKTLVVCAQQNITKGSTDLWGMAACYAGPQLLKDMNPEAVIAAQCAVQSGGNPKAFAVCTGGALTAREIDKCLSKGIGGKNGCFGENNTIVKAFRDAEAEIVDTFGRDSPAHIAWRAATFAIDPNQAASVANDFLRESGKAGQNVGKELEIAAQKVAKVMPRVKIKRIKITW